MLGRRGEHDMKARISAVASRVALGTLLLLAVPAYAKTLTPPDPVPRHPPHGPRGGDHRWVPEFDPAAAGAVGALIAGGGLLLARRRR